MRRRLLAALKIVQLCSRRHCYCRRCSVVPDQDPAAKAAAADPYAQARSTDTKSMQRRDGTEYYFAVVKPRGRGTKHERGGSLLQDSAATRRKEESPNMRTDQRPRRRWRGRWILLKAIAAQAEQGISRLQPRARRNSNDSAAMAPLPPTWIRDSDAMVVDHGQRTARAAEAAAAQDSIALLGVRRRQWLSLHPRPRRYTSACTHTRQEQVAARYHRSTSQAL
jgi:hypothetical protein